MNPFSTDIDREFKEVKDDPEFTRRFFRDITLIFIFSIIGVALILSVICNAKEINHFISGLVSDLFFGLNKQLLYALISLSCGLLSAWIIAIGHAKETILHSTRWGR